MHHALGMTKTTLGIISRTSTITLQSSTTVLCFMYASTSLVHQHPLDPGSPGACQLGNPTSTPSHNSGFQKNASSKESTPPPVVAVVTNMNYGCVSFFTKFQSTLLVPVQMASPQRRPTAETGYSSGRFLKLDNKSKTRITFFHFFS